MTCRFDHFNFNVLNLERSLAFYQEAFGFVPVAEKTAADGSFRLVFLGDGDTGFRLELTWLRDRKEPYDLGELEYHLAVQAEEYDTIHQKHRAMGIVCYENPDMGIYFVQDPDGYWIEVVQAK